MLILGTLDCSSKVVQGQNLGDAALAAGVPFVVFSGGERIGVDAMDNKIKVHTNQK